MVIVGILQVKKLGLYDPPTEIAQSEVMARPFGNIYTQQSQPIHKGTTNPDVLKVSM